MYLTEEQVMLRDTVREFAKKEIEPIALEIDRMTEFPAENLRKMDELGFLDIPCLTEYRESGMDTLSFTLMIEEIAKACGSTCLSVATPYGFEMDKLSFAADWTHASELTWKGVNLTYEAQGWPPPLNKDRFYLALDHTVDHDTLSNEMHTLKLVRSSSDFAKEVKLEYPYGADQTIMHTESSLKKKLEVLNIFMASPGDLTTERRVVRKVVNVVNRIVDEELSWHVKLLGWEDTLPGCARPQAIINKEIDSCDLFIGLLWKRWGQPTGTYTSGFEEEFERARKRRAETGTPEIWVFFKHVEPALVDDAGEQLQRVLAFRKEREASKELLFKEFLDPKGWKEKLFECLLRYILSLSRRHLQTA